MPDSTETIAFDTFAEALHYASNEDAAFKSEYDMFKEQNKTVQTAVDDIERMRKEHLLDPALFEQTNYDELDAGLDQRISVDLTGYFISSLLL